MAMASPSPVSDTHAVFHDWTEVPLRNAPPKSTLVTNTKPLQHSSLHHPPTTELAFKRSRARVVTGFLDQIDFLNQLHPQGRK